MAKNTLIDTFKSFFKSEQAGGFILLFCVAISLIIANSPYQDNLADFLQTKLGYAQLNYSILTWINDGLMAIFFLFVGLEIKREIVEGELSTLKNAALPIVAAIGGMLTPALIYFLFNKNTLTAGGWGIPMATDIAFALAILALLGKKVPTSLKVFLAALAIVDDLGAILVIAVFYTQKIHFEYLAMAALLTAILAAFNYFGLRKLIFYLVPGVFLWYVLHHSGIHATIAGVILAFTIPGDKVKQTSALLRLEHALTTPVNYLIMPLFALANTNITFAKEMFSGLLSPLGLGIIFGLFVGKTFGITLFSWLAVKFKLASLPTNTAWKHIIGIGMLAGIGFTMSIFVSMLSFNDASNVGVAKFAILIASVLSGVIGFSYLKSIHK